MLASDLFGTRVLDVDGDDLGCVDDVRVVRDGPYIEGFGAAMRVDGLVVGDGGVAVRLGYVRHGVQGPALLSRWAKRQERRCLVVAWDQVASVDPDAVRLHVARAALHPVEGVASPVRGRGRR
jgi:sporulation protein YlmC with PRC-barrel domain